MLKDMKSYRHVKPGQKGSKRLVELYGDRLLCVRYRYDENRGVRLKTVELVVECCRIKAMTASVPLQGRGYGTGGGRFRRAGIAGKA